ncbi:MAG: DUF883 family protein [Verrucomicrobia bacterium]|nr:DUF883 family protein [Verrucomicrobiota bacterium]
MSEADVNTERLVQDLKTVARDAEELMKATADMAGEKAAEVKSRLTSIAENAKTACQRLEEQASVHVENADKVIRSHPYESVGIAFGVGVLLGVLLGRK